MITDQKRIWSSMASSGLKPITLIILKTFLLFFSLDLKINFPQSMTLGGCETNS